MDQEVIASTVVTMEELKQQMENKGNEIKELWFDFENEYGTKVRMGFNYLYSKKFMYDNMVGEFREQLTEDVMDYTNVLNYLNKLESMYPFLDFKGDRENKIGITMEDIARDKNTSKEFKEQYPGLHKFEKEYVNPQVKVASDKVNELFNRRGTNWVKCLHVLISITLILNVFACWARPDFITSLVVALAVFFLNDTTVISKDQFRFVPLLMFVSIVYDFFWLFFVQDYEKEGERLDGGIEASVKRFTIYISWIHFFFKIATFFVVWRVSVNYLVDLR